MKKPKVHPEQIPESSGNSMARSLFSIVQEYFSDPENKKEYEEWLETQAASRQDRLSGAR